MRKPLKIWHYLLLAVGFLAIGFFFSSKNQRVEGTKPNPKAVREVTITRNCFCGRSKGDAGTIYRAVAASDTQAVAGLLARGKALSLDKGTRVRVAGITGGVAYIRILSGYQTGETCWIPENLL